MYNDFDLADGYDPYDDIPFGDAQHWEDEAVFQDTALDRYDDAVGYDDDDYDDEDEFEDTYGYEDYI